MILLLIFLLVGECEYMTMIDSRTRPVTLDKYSVNSEILNVFKQYILGNSFQ